MHLHPQEQQYDLLNYAVCIGNFRDQDFVSYAEAEGQDK